MKRNEMGIQPGNFTSFGRVKLKTEGSACRIMKVENERGKSWVRKWYDDC